MFALLVFLFGLKATASLKFDISKKPANSCLNYIYKTEFDEGSLALVADNFEKLPVPEKPQFVTNYENFEQVRANNFILYEDESSKLISLFPKLNQLAKYLILAQNSSSVYEILKLAQKFGIKKLLVLLDEDLYYRTNGHICEDKPVIIKSKNCNYPKEIFTFSKTFRNCDLKVGYITTPPFVINIAKSRNPGIMLSMTQVLAKASNLEVTYRPSEDFDSELLNNGSVHKIARALETQEIDLAIGHLFFNDTKTTPFEFGPSFENDSITLAVAKPKKLHSYKKLFVVFEIEIWVRVFLGILVMVLLFYVFGLIENFEKTTIFQSLFDVFHISIGGGLTSLPNWISFRILLAFFFIFSLSMDSIYLGNLSQIFAFSSYDVPVESIYEALHTKVKFQVPFRMERLVLLWYVSRDAPTRAQRLFITNFTDYYLMNQTAICRENVTMLFKSVVKSYPSEAALMDFLTVGTDYLTLYVTVYFHKNSKYTEALKFWSHEIMERGLPQKWFNDIRVSNVKPWILPEEEAKVVVLKVAHFEESFRVLVGGYLMAVVALLLEFVFLKLEQKGVVKKVRDFVIFSVMLLKPPELHKTSTVEDLQETVWH